MQILLRAICRAGLNKGRIRDAITGLESYSGVTGDMIFDPNCKNIRPLYLASVHDGKITYRLATMNKESASIPELDNRPRPATPAGPGVSAANTSISIPYAIVGEDGVTYAGPKLQDLRDQSIKVAVFGRDAERIVRDLTGASLNHKASSSVILIPVPSETSWGKSSTALVHAVYEDKVLAILALDRASSHLAEQVAVKSFVPVIAISDDRTLTSANIPWIFRVPASASPSQVLDAAQASKPNRTDLRDVLASGRSLNSFRFSPTGEPQPVESRF